MKIQNLKARKILNSAGNWTVECQLTTKDKIVTASVPTGISTGKEEKPSVVVKKAIKQIEEEIFPKIENKNLNQKELDNVLSRDNWGSNTTLAVSAAFFKLNTSKVLRSNSLDGVIRPKLMMLMFEGKKHGNRDLKIQEFMLIFDKVEDGVKVYREIKEKLETKNLMTTVGAEGGFSPPNLNDEQILDLLSEHQLPIGLDIAANTNPFDYSTLLNIVRRWKIRSIEDPFPETERGKWHKFYQQAKEIHPDILIIGDDLTVTNEEEIKKAAEENLINGVIIKPNQQGTITAAKRALETARELGLKTVVSHRGESTNDTWLADFALLYRADFVKFGAPARGERVAKYNRLLKVLPLP